MHLLNRLRPLIILLFTLTAGSISMAAAADTVIVGTITAIDREKRELIVSPVHAARVAGETGSTSSVHVRLEWDPGPENPFDGLLPGCAIQGNDVRITGIYDRNKVFQAAAIHGCGAGDFSDNTGVRYRLNRARGACAAP